MQNRYRLLIFFFFLILIALPLFLAIFISSPGNKAVFQSKAQTVGGKIDAIQQQINSAKDGATITIPAGTYSGSTAVPDEQNPQVTCFLNLGSKKITLKGENGAILFGEGHDKPDTYAARAGICSNGGDVIIDNLHIKEFQGGGLRFTNSRLILKNSIVEGNDSGAMNLNNTSLLAVNDFFVANIGISPRGLAPIKAYSNTFYGSKGINAECNKDLPPIDFVNNIVVDSELIIGAGWIYGDCPATAAQFKSKHIVYNLIWKSGSPCYENHEYCDNFTGKINADPLYIEPVVDQRGIAGWANFGFKEGSPVVVGVGDPSIPGPKILGHTGGPCVDPNSSICSSFIKTNIPKIVEPPTSTSVPEEEVEEPPAPTQQPQPEKTTLKAGPLPSPIYNDVFNQEQAALYIENIGNSKTLKIIYLYLQDTSQKVDKELTSSQSLKYSFASLCQGLKLNIKGALLYSSSEDNHQKIRYKNLNFDCYKTTIIDIE